MIELWQSVNYTVTALALAMMAKSSLRMCLKAFDEARRREMTSEHESKLEGIEQRLERVESVARAVNLSNRLKR